MVQRIFSLAILLTVGATHAFAWPGELFFRNTLSQGDCNIEMYAVIGTNVWDGSRNYTTGFRGIVLSPQTLAPGQMSQANFAADGLELETPNFSYGLYEIEIVGARAITFYLDYRDADYWTGQLPYHPPTFPNGDVEILIRNNSIEIGRYEGSPDDPQYRIPIQNGATYRIWEIKHKELVYPPTGGPNLFYHFNIPFRFQTNIGGQIKVNGVSQNSPFQGSYQAGSGTTVSAEALPTIQKPDGIYSFTGWSDGIQSPIRTFTLSGDASYYNTALPFVYTANYVKYLLVSISGPRDVYCPRLKSLPCNTYTWTTSVTNGTPPYSYSWEILSSTGLWSPIAGGTSVTKTFCWMGNNPSTFQSGLRVTVRDANNQTATCTYLFTVHVGGTGGGGDMKQSNESTMNQPITYTDIANYPNPFNPTTMINYQLSKPSRVALRVYNVLGQELATLQEGVKDAGAYSVSYSAAKELNQSSGIYFACFIATPLDGSEPFVKTIKMVLSK